MKFRNQILTIIISSLVLVLVLSVATARNSFSRTLKENEKAALYNQCQYLRLSGLANNTEGLDEYALLHNVRITLIDEEGVPLYDSLVNYKFLENHFYRPEIVSARENEKGFAVRESSSTYHSTMYCAEYNDKLYVRVAKNIEDLNVWNSEFLSTLWPTLSIITLLVLIAAIILIYHLSRPVKMLTESALSYGRGDFSKKTNIDRPEEFALLSVTLNEMAGHIEAQIKQLSEDKNTYSSMLSSMTEGVICTDKKGNITLCNNEAIRMFGMKITDACSLMECLGDRKLNLKTDEVIKTGLSDSFSMVRFNGLSGETADTLGEGKQRYYNVAIAPIKQNDNVTGTVMAFSDITELKHLEQIRKDFVANVSHELKTPLTSIEGFSEILQNPSLSDDERARFASIISKNSHQMKQIVQDLLTLASIEKEGTAIPMKCESIKNIVESAVESVSYKAQEKNIKIVLKQPEKDKELYCAPRLLQQAVSNLISNSVSYSPESSSVEVTVAFLDQNLSIEVKDNGIGIAEIHQSRIFERFYRVDRDRSRNSGGTGLGLSIVRHIADLHNGTITLNSTIGKGSVFTIIIPFQQKDLSFYQGQEKLLYPN